MKIISNLNFISQIHKQSEIIQNNELIEKLKHTSHLRFKCPFRP